MGKLLTQEEVDALLQGLSDGEIETEGAEETGSREALPYDFFSQDHILHCHMPTMEIINEKFARQSTTSLFGFMGKMIEVSVGSFELLKYAELIRSLPERASFNVYGMDPLRGSCLFFFDAKLICLVVDILFGGSGRLPVEMHGRDFTTMEYRVIRRLLNMCFQDLEKAWSVVGEMSFRTLRSETNPQFVNIVPPDEIVMSSVFQVDMEHGQVVMGYCIPYSSLEPIKNKLCGNPSPKDLQVDESWKGGLTEHLRAVPVEISAELGSSEITLRDLLNLKENDILPMNVGINDPMVLKIQDVEKGRCMAGQRNGNYAIEVLAIDATFSKEKTSGSTRGTQSFHDRGGDPLDRGIFAGAP